MFGKKQFLIDFGLSLTKFSYSFSLVAISDTYYQYINNYIFLIAIKNLRADENLTKLFLRIISIFEILVSTCMDYLHLTRQV